MAVFRIENEYHNILVFLSLLDVFVYQNNFQRSEGHLKVKVIQGQPRSMLFKMKEKATRYMIQWMCMFFFLIFFYLQSQHTSK